MISDAGDLQTERDEQAEVAAAAGGKTIVAVLCRTVHGTNHFHGNNLPEKEIEVYKSYFFVPSRVIRRLIPTSWIGPGRHRRRCTARR